MASDPARTASTAELHAPPLDLAAHRRLALRWGYGLTAFPIGAVLVTLVLGWHSRYTPLFGVREALVAILITATISAALGAVTAVLIRVVAYNHIRAEDRAWVRRAIGGVGLAASAWLALAATFVTYFAMVGDG